MKSGLKPLPFADDPFDLALVIGLVLEGREPRVERWRADRAARDEKAVDVVEQLSVADRVADAHAREAIRLGEGAGHDHVVVVVHKVHRISLPIEVGVGGVEQQRHTRVGEPAEVIDLHCIPGRVIWAAHDGESRFGGDRREESVGVVVEAIVREGQRDDDDACLERVEPAPVHRPRRVGNHDLAADAGERPKDCVDHLGRACGDDHL